MIFSFWLQKSPAVGIHHMTNRIGRYFTNSYRSFSNIRLGCLAHVLGMVWQKNKMPGKVLHDCQSQQISPLDDLIVWWKYIRLHFAVLNDEWHFPSSLAPSCLTDPFDSHLKVWLHYPTSLHLDVEGLWAALCYFRGRFQLQITRPSSKILEAPFGRLSEWTQSMMLQGSTSCPILPYQMGGHGENMEHVKRWKTSTR